MMEEFLEIRNEFLYSEEEYGKETWWNKFVNAAKKPISEYADFLWENPDTIDESTAFYLWMHMHGPFRNGGTDAEDALEDAIEMDAIKFYDSVLGKMDSK